MTGPVNVPLQQVQPLLDLRGQVRVEDLARQVASSDGDLTRRQGIISASTDVHTYDVVLSGSGVTIPGVKSMAAFAPVVGDTVWLSVLPTGSYAITEIQAKQVYQADIITGINVVATTAVTVALVFPVPYTVAASISVNANVETPAFQRFYAYVNGVPTTTGCSFRVQQGENISTSINGLKLHWHAAGI